jgi:hypothetical protein
LDASAIRDSRQGLCARKGADVGQLDQTVNYIADLERLVKEL